MKNAVALACLMAGLVAPVATATPAQAGGGKCASLAERGKVKKGMTLAKVVQIIDYKGVVSYTNDDIVVRDFDYCQQSDPANYGQRFQVIFDKETSKVRSTQTVSGS